MSSRTDQDQTTAERSVSPLAGKPADPLTLVNIPRLIASYYTERPDPSVPAHHVSFGTSGHRGSAFKCGFNEWHVLAIAQAICRYRASQGIDGPLFLGIDTHALSEPASRSALEVLAANGVHVQLAVNDEYTPTPTVSQAILNHNRGRRMGLADGIVITPSHNPPEDGGFKYNPPHGGPAGTDVTRVIEAAANESLRSALADVKRIPYQKALAAATTHRHDYLNGYVDEIAEVVDVEAIKTASLRLAVDPLGGAGVRYWGAIAEKYGLNLTVTNPHVDPTFRMIPLDFDGRIRMDPSSRYAMQSLIALRDRFDVAFACDADHDRHGVVTKAAGLLPPNHYLVACIQYLFAHRPQWPAHAGVGKTAVSSSMIDRVTGAVGRPLYEVPVGFKWFVDGLLNGTLGFVGEESAGAALLRRNGTVWTTDKDGIVVALLAAEMMAKTGRDPGEIYQAATREHGDPVYERIDAPADQQARAALARVSAVNLRSDQLAGERIVRVFTTAPGNGEPLGGIKVAAESGWFAARPSGTEELYKIYAESFRGADHLRQIQNDARTLVSSLISAPQ